MVDGEGRVGPDDRPVRRGQLAIFGDDGDEVALAAPAAATDVLAARPGCRSREPVARYGPFVMNTPERDPRGAPDYQAGRLGRIAP